mgnify:CR=1 FL=1
MTEQPLKGVRVLVAEDEYLIADALCKELQTSGAQIIGPVAQMEAALSLARGDNIDAAVLDINLGGVEAYPVADLLTSRGVPVVFATGYDVFTIPVQYARVLTFMKPFRATTIVKALRHQLGR